MEGQKAFSVISPIKTPNRNTFLNFDKVNLLELIEKSGLGDLAVVVISIAGAFRKGKSFMLNLIIKFLNSKNQAGLSWLEDDDKLIGFDWRSGTDRTTEGILIWSEIFRISTPDRDIALILMDTQGTFDNQTTIQECSAIFALSSLMSSIQIFNLHAQIQENDLQYLQMFLEYGKLAKESNNAECPFQKLVFLIRDWANPDVFDYGEVGGNQLVNSYLKIEKDKPEEQSLLREYIKNCYKEISGYLLPYPGQKVATRKSFTGKASDMDEDPTRKPT